jgi:hypothetical protein
MLYVQMATRVCREPQSWSGGLTIKCANAVAIRIDDSNVFTIHKDKGTRINGEEIKHSKRRLPVCSHRDNAG